MIAGSVSAGKRKLRANASKFKSIKSVFVSRMSDTHKKSTRAGVQVEEDVSGLGVGQR